MCVCVKTRAPFCSPQNSWDLWISIEASSQSYLTRWLDPSPHQPDLVVPQIIDQMPRGQRMPRAMTSPAPPASANESSREGYKAEDTSQVSLGPGRNLEGNLEGELEKVHKSYEIFDFSWKIWELLREPIGDAIQFLSMWWCPSAQASLQAPQTCPTCPTCPCRRAPGAKLVQLEDGDAVEAPWGQQIWVSSHLGVKLLVKQTFSLVNPLDGLMIA